MSADEALASKMVLETRGLTKEFRGFTAVDDVTIINGNPKRNHSLIQRIILNVKQNEERTILVSF